MAHSTPITSGVGHRGGYRDAARPRVPATKVAEGLEELEGLRRHELGGSVLWMVVALFGGLLGEAIVVQLTDSPAALACGVVGALVPLALSVRRARRARALALRDAVLVSGRLVRSRIWGWRFVGDDGARYTAFPRAQREAWQRGGPYVARVVRDLRVSIRWAPVPIDEAEEAELRQSALDAQLGVTSADREMFAEARVPWRFRAWAGLCATACVLPILLCASILAAMIAAGVAPGGPTVLAIASLALIWVALPSARAAREGCCRTVEGDAFPSVFHGGRSVLYGFQIGHVWLHLSESALGVVERGQRVRAYYCPHRNQLLALEHLSASPWPRPCQGTEEAARCAQPTLDELRRRFH